EMSLMTTDEIPPEKPALIIDAHPTLGKYIAHHPSNRLRLIAQAISSYALAVLIVQALFWQVEDGTASLFLPLLFSAVGLGTAWYVAHYWNREIVLYEQGFSYRQGSQVGHFRYTDIVRLQPDVNRFALLSRFQGTTY